MLGGNINKTWQRLYYFIYSNENAYGSTDVHLCKVVYDQ